MYSLRNGKKTKKISETVVLNELKYTLILRNFVFNNKNKKKCFIINKNIKIILENTEIVKRDTKQNAV